MALQKSLLPVAQDSTQTLPPAGVRDLTNTDIQRIQASLDHSACRPPPTFPITPEKCTPRLGAPSRAGPGPGVFSPCRRQLP